MKQGVDWPVLQGCTAPQQIQDLKCGVIERRYKYCTNPTQLIYNIPHLVPIANKALQKTAEPGAFKLVK